MRPNKRESKSKIHRKIDKAIQSELIWWDEYYNKYDDHDDYFYMHDYDYIKRDYKDEPIPHCVQVDMESFRDAGYLREIKIRRLLKLDKDIIPRFGDIINLNLKKK